MDTDREKEEESGAVQFVRGRVPNASEEEIHAAAENVRAWLREWKHVYDRLMREGYFEEDRKESFPE